MFIDLTIYYLSDDEDCNVMLNHVVMFYQTCDSFLYPSQGSIKY